MDAPPEPEPVTITFSPPIEAEYNGHHCRVIALHWKWGLYGTPSHAVLAHQTGNIEFTHAQGLTLPPDYRVWK